MVAWVVIVLCVGFVFYKVYIKSKTGSAAMQAQLALTCRYAVGTTKILPSSPGQMLTEVKRQVKVPSERLLVAPVIAELSTKEEAISYIEATSGLEPAAAKARETLLKIYAAGASSIPKDEALVLENELGWCGRLALTWQMPDTAPERAKVLSGAKRTAMTLIAAAIIVLLLIGIGLVMGIVALVLRLTGVIQKHYAPDLPPLAPYVEGFALFLAIYVGASFIKTLLEKVGVAGLVGLQIALFATCLYPLLRGVNWREYRHAIGWHGGAGIFTEVGCGLLGYLAGLPIVVLGGVCSYLLVKLTGAEQPIHPISGEVGEGILSILLLYLAAAIIAPVMEETLFRGMLYHHVRAKMHWIFAAMLVGFIFAAIHPQGWAAIPVLGAIGFVLAMIREWRGSLIASITAHAFNNGLLVTMLICATR